MAISSYTNDNEKAKFVESTSAANKPAVRVSNGDGSDISGTKGGTSNTTTVTSVSNTLPMARYNASPTARTEGQFGNLQADANGDLNVNLGTTLSFEDQSNSVGQMALKPLAASTYTPTRVSSTALEASHILKNAAGNLYHAFGVIDKSAATGQYYIIFLDSATLTADGAVTHLITPVPVNHTTGVDSSFEAGPFNFGVAAANGIVIVLSTTMVTKTIAGSYLFATGLVK